jgi:hypothetical protein
MDHSGNVNLCEKASDMQRMDSNGDLALPESDLPIPSLNMEFMGQQRQGDEVLVLGYPLGLSDAGGQATLTRGIISSTLKDTKTGQALIQTDAAVNHGNSGGAMVNMQGSLIGIPSYGLRTNGGQGVNFAIAVDTVNAFLNTPQTIVGPSILLPDPPPSAPPTAPAPIPAPSAPRFTGDAYALFPSAAELGPGFVNKGVGCNPTTARFLADPVVRCEQQFLNGGPDTIRNIDIEVHSGPDQAASEFQHLADEYFKRPIQTMRPDVACVQGLYVCRRANAIVWVYMKDSYDQRILDLVLSKIEQHLA